MTLNLSLSPHLEARLRERAAASGQPLDQYALRILEAVAAAPNTTDALAVARQQIAASGMSDAELDGLLEELRNDVWREKQNKGS